MMLDDSTSSVSSILLGSFVLAIVYYITTYITWSISRRNFVKQNGCKPPAKQPLQDPFFGIDAMRDTLRALESKTFLKQKRELYEQYGNTFSSRVVTRPLISTIEPENIKAVLQTKFDDFEVGAPRRDAFSPVLGKSIFLSDGKRWEHSRAFLRPSFARSQVGDLSILEVHVQNLIKAIPNNGSTFDLADLFVRYTADVTTDFMFGESIMSLSRREAFQADLMEAFHEAQLGCERRFRLGRFAKVIPQRKFFRAVKLIHTYMDAHIDKALESRNLQQESSKDVSKTNERHIFARELAKITDDRKVLRDELLTIFFAGRDTTSALLSNLFFVLARDPEVWQRLRVEVNELKGKKPTLEGLKNMKYLRFCINEVLRLYPVVAGTSRVATRDTVLPYGGGPDGQSPIFVANGTLVAYHFSALHLRKDLWGSDADEFKPERWENEKDSWKFLPFGGGRRNCMGQQFALNEASYTAVRLVQEFSAIENRDPKPWTENVGATCSSANGVQVAMVPKPGTLVA